MRVQTPQAPWSVLRSSLSWSATCGVAVLLASGSASAHVALTSPPARYTQEHQKAPPCGHAANPAGDVEPTILAGGETIVVSLDEYIDHASHFRIAIASNDGEFFDPIDYDDFYSVENVVLDDIEDVPGTRYHDIELTVPDIDCDPCVLQVLQVMYSGNPFSQSALYYQCADVVIEASAVATTGDDDDTGGGDDDTGNGDTTDAGEAGEAGSSGTGGSDGSGDDGVRPGETEGSDTSPSGDEGGDDGCGCHATRERPAGAALLGLLFVGTITRRRR